jgi:hypothetical protein
VESELSNFSFVPPLQLILRRRQVAVGRMFSSPIIIDFNVVENYLLSLSQILESAMMNKLRFYRMEKGFC